MRAAGGSCGFAAKTNFAQSAFRMWTRVARILRAGHPGWILHLGRWRRALSAKRRWRAAGLNAVANSCVAPNKAETFCHVFQRAMGAADGFNARARDPKQAIRASATLRRR